MGIFPNIILIAILVILVPYTSSANCSMEVPAKDVIAMLANNNEVIKYNDAVINGDLILRKKPKSDVKNIKAKIYINNSVINGSVDLQEIVFNKEIVFDNVTFNQVVDFGGSSFDDKITFINCKFKNMSCYDRCNFKKMSLFRLVEFSKNASFEESAFEDLIIKNVHFNESAYFRNSHINGSIVLRGTNFSEADFTESELHDSDFIDTEFNISVFNKAKFFGDTNFRKAKINDGHFEKSEFKGKADFSSAKIYDCIYFTDSVFYGDFNFIESYASNAVFKGSQFHGDAIFQDGIFKEVAQFANSKFDKLANFQNASFGDTNFNGSEFGRDGGLANFKEASFANDVSFSDSNFNKDAYFTKANFFGNQVSFKNVDFKEDAFFEDIKIKGMISLTKTNYNDLYIRYSDIAGKLDFNDEAYLKLIKNLNNQALFYDADKLYHEYRTQYRKKGWDSSNANEKADLALGNITSWIMAKSDVPFRKFIDTTLDFSYAYGTEPIRPFYFSLIIIISFAALWWSIGFRKKFFVAEFQSNEGETRIDNFVRNFINETNRVKDSIIFSILLFLSGTRLFVDPPKLPGFPAKSSRLAKIMYFSERILGALFLALLLISISKTIIRSPTNLI